MIPHPERVLFPRDGITRAELVTYYREMAPAILPHLRGRAITVRRWPHGIDAPSFYQKRAPIPRGAGAGGGDPARPIRIAGEEDLVTWVGWGAIEFHAPLHREGEAHDMAVLDLDPNPPAGWAEVRRVAGVARQLFEELRLPHGIKTSGGDGLHFYVPLRPTLSAAEATGWMEAVARLIVAAVPTLATITRRVAARGPRVYVDYLQNGRHRTMAVVFGVRGRDGAPVSYPVTWADVLAQRPEAFTIRSVRRAHPAGWADWPGVPPVDLGRALAARGISDPAALRRMLPVEVMSRG
jgi:bifunctional non-homologous end joining protein LigD